MLGTGVALLPVGSFSLLLVALRGKTVVSGSFALLVGALTSAGQKDREQQAVALVVSK